MGIATLNALSAPEVEWQSGDPIASLDDAVATIATVGLFRPAFRKFSAVDVRVVEREPLIRQSPDDVTVDLFPPDQCETAFAGADVCFITGSTLVPIGSLSLGTEIRRRAAIVLVGATASFVPGPAFDAGIDLVAGARVRNPAGVRASVRAGDCGTDLHDSGLEKVYVARSSSFRALAGRGETGRNERTIIRNRTNRTMNRTDNDWSTPENEVLQRARELVERGDRGVLATVVNVEGSAYRRPGAKMLVSADGTEVGHITAGCLEDEVQRLAADVLRPGNHVWRRTT